MCFAVNLHVINEAENNNKSVAFQMYLEKSLYWLCTFLVLDFDSADHKSTSNFSISSTRVVTWSYDGKLHLLFGNKIQGRSMHALGNFLES